MRVLTAVEGGCGAGADRVGVEVEGRRALPLAPPVLGARSLPRPAPPTRRCYDNLDLSFSQQFSYLLLK